MSSECAVRDVQILLHNNTFVSIKQIHIWACSPFLLSQAVVLQMCIMSI